jgi:serine/threonine-protein kinase
MGGMPVVGEPFGGFQIHRRIGRGGMGAVFEATDIRLDRRVALKVVASEHSDDPGFRRRFEREASMLATLDSPHVIQLYDFGEIDGSLFLVTQLVSGPDLGTMLDDRGPLPVDVALDVVEQLAGALADAHEAGLVHRDVKPSNVLVRQSGHNPFVYLCDFGVAASIATGVTHTSAFAGTTGYMAPERHAGQSADERSDIYSLGCVLWASLTGRMPYEGASDVQVAMAHLQQPVPVWAGSPPAREEINAVLARSMAKEPADRYRTAEDMRVALVAAGRAARDLSREGASTGAGAAGAISRAGVTELRSAPHPGLGAPVKDRRPPRGRAVLVGAAAVLVLGGAAAAGATLVNRPSPSTAAPPHPSTRSRQPATTHAPRGSSSMGATSSPRAQPATTSLTRAGSPRPSTSASDPAPTTSAPSASAPSQRSASLTCLDGSPADTAAECDVPMTKSGLASVFPSCGDGCSATSLRVEGKTQAFEQAYPDFMIRYSRWEPGRARRYAYLDTANPGADKATWYIGGEPAGEQWTSYETPDEDPRENKRFQWSATYDDREFEVSVEGVTAGARARGMRLVRATPPSRIGLRRGSQ